MRYEDFFFVLSLKLALSFIELLFYCASLFAGFVSVASVSSYAFLSDNFVYNKNKKNCVNGFVK